MVPILIVHCVSEIESRGLRQVGLYRVPGSEKEVKILGVTMAYLLFHIETESGVFFQERFIKRKEAPPLHEVDIHVLCGTVKDFLRSLNEPLVTYARWRDFTNAAEIKDEQDRKEAFYGAISDLPQPNRDTLAYMILHLKKYVIQFPSVEYFAS